MVSRIRGDSNFDTDAVTRSVVQLRGANGYGSTATRWKRWLSAVRQVGADITYADSAVNGASFTINQDGIYSINYGCQFSAGEAAQISLNDTAPTAAPNASETLMSSNTAGPQAMTAMSWTGFLAAGSVIRTRSTGGTAAGTSTYGDQFVIARVG